MSRYALQQSQPAPPTIEGDQSFTALNMKTDRAMLSPGYYARAINKRCADGVVRKRPGTVKPAFANALPFGSIAGSGVYSNPNKDESLAIADGVANKVYQVRDGTQRTTVRIPEGETLDTEVTIVQANDKVLLLRKAPAFAQSASAQGSGATGGSGVANERRRPLIWDGVSSGGFTLAEKSDPGNAEVSTIPNIETAEAFEDRIVFPLPDDPNSFGMSDSLDYTTWDPLLSKFTIPSSAGDEIVRLFNWSNGNLIIFKGRSIKLARGFTQLSLGPDGVTLGYWEATFQKVNDSLGLKARKAVIDRGGDVDFLAEPGGIYSITQVLQDKTEATAIPISDPIEPLIRRINWPFAHKAVAARLGKYNFWAVPLDRSETNNALLVCDTTRQTQMSKGDTSYSIPVAWEGVDIFAGAISIDDLWVTNYLGAQRLYAIDKVAKAIYVLGVGHQDELSPSPGSGVARVRHEIADLFETRGYATLGWNASTRRDFKHCEIEIETWRASANVTLINEGNNNERLLTTDGPVTAERRNYSRFGMPAFDGRNVNNDFNAPGREDYSVAPGPTSVGPGIHLWDGIALEKKQASALRFATKARGRWASLRIENSQGEADIKSILFDSSGVTRVARRAA